MIEERACKQRGRKNTLTDEGRRMSHDDEGHLGAGSKATMWEKLLLSARFRKPRRVWEDELWTCLLRVGIELNWIELAEERDPCRVLNSREIVEHIMCPETGLRGFFSGTRGKCQDFTFAIDLAIR